MSGRVFVALLSVLISACSAIPTYQPADIRIEDAHGGSHALAFNQQESLLASGGWEGDLKLWNPINGKLQRSWQAHKDAISTIIFSDNDRTLLTASYDASLAVWNTQGKLLKRRSAPSAITDMQLDVKQKRVITGHSDGVLREWRMPTLEPIAEKKLHDGAIHSITLHAASGTIASSGNDGRVLTSRDRRHWDELPSPPVDAHSLAFSPDGDILFGSGWFRLFRWQMANKSLKVLDTDHRGLITGIKHSNKGNYLATISRQTDSAVMFLDPADGSVKRRFQPHELCGAYIVLSPTEHFLATTSDDASIMIWDIRK